MIDDFAAPTPSASYVISFTTITDTFLAQHTGANILGGQRDLLVNALPPVSPVSAVGLIGGGTYLFGSAGTGVTATLQYDGSDVELLPPLTNANGLGGLDLTVDGNDRLRFDFLSIDGGVIDGGVDSSLDIRISVAGASGTASVTKSVPQGLVPPPFFVPFTEFSSFSFSNVSSLEITINPNAVRDVDFELTSIVVVPEPDSFALLALAIFGTIFCWHRPRRSAP